MSSPKRLVDGHSQSEFTAPIRTLPESVISQIRTNYIPSAIEMVQISRCLTVAHADLKNYEEEISRICSIVGPAEREVRALTGQLKRGRAALLVYIDGYRSLQAPIRTLPTEILGEIFIWCMPDYVTDPISRPEGQMPFKIGRVCTLWRAIVLSLQQLWSSIHLALLDTNQRSKNILKTYLTRSGQHPLSITVSESKSKTRRCLGTLLSLVRESHRWRRMRLMIKSSTYKELASCFDPIEQNLPLLEELVICGIASEAKHFIVCPKLHTLDKVYDRDNPGPDCPRDQITTLVLHTRSTADALVLISRHPNIQHCTLRVGGHLGHPQGTDPMIPIKAFPVTHNLAALTLQLPAHVSGNSGGFTLLLKNLTLPFLKSLEVHSQGQIPRGWESNLLTKFLRRSSCALEMLTLKSTTVEESELAKLLTFTPTLKILKLDRFWDESDDHPLMGTFAKTLTITPLPPATDPNSIDTCPFLVPQLTHLDLVVANPYIDEISIAEMVESRRPRVVSPALSGSNSSLEGVTITFLNRTRALHPNLRRRMVALSLGGLEVTLRP